MQDMAKTFLHRATDYLEAEFRGIADGAVAAAGNLSPVDRLKQPNHVPIHATAKQLAPLLEVVVAMRPGALTPLRGHYCKAVNNLLKQEVTGAAKELVRQVTASAGAAGADAELSLKHADSVK